MSGARKVAKLASTVALWAAIGFVVTMLAAVTLPNLFGYRSLTVLTGSMQPTLMTGDMVVGKWIRADQARPGDIVTFKSAERGGKLVTHRVRSVQTENGRVAVVTKGDANDTVERWTVPANGRISRVEVDVPKIGYAANAISGPRGKIMLVVIPAALLALFELVRIWRPERESEDEARGDGALGGTHA